ncbi:MULTISPECIES: hypothetical protein [Pectobacterium]|uniref:hypothetical protein n=2 Tax=Pectobacterium TaxID=122277 RepID=UPI00069B5C27|nr:MULTISPECIES: hypothetical protein [Pectobacterium]MBG0750355.1 hypothetical protein [Pectobacterium carotovorum subsp. carotovorum PCCS1]MCG5047676.1 hypothetical protein [Pectobacterium brasiliense]
MLWITTIIDLVKNGIGYFTKRSQSKDELQAQNSHEQNQITLEETRKGFTWRQGLGWVLTFIVLWNYVMVPLLALMGVVLPVLPLDEVWKVLLVLIGSG